MVGIAEVLISYDIACQYSRNFQTRFLQLPAFLLVPLHLLILFLIPKFHLPVHKEECRYNFSFNYTKQVGRTDGEGIERFWGAHNHLSGSTMRMTPGSRLDTLNFHFNDWNWRKLCKMGQAYSIFFPNSLQLLTRQFPAGAVLTGQRDGSPTLSPPGRLSRKRRR